MQELLKETKGLRIATTRTDCVCAYSGDTIPQGSKGLLFRQEDSRESKDLRYSTWVSLKYREEFADQLEEYNFTAETPRSDISPYGAIGYSTVGGETASCLACGESMDNGEEGIAMVNYTNRTQPDTAWMHTHCTEIIVNILRGEDYTAELAAASI